MFATNELTAGRLMTTDHVKTNQVHADLWQIKENPTVSSDEVATFSRASFRGKIVNLLLRRI